MCHLCSADLQPQGLNKFQLRERLCIRVRQQICRLVKLWFRNGLKHPFLLYPESHHAGQLELLCELALVNNRSSQEKY